ncbi:MAG: ABC transporter permease [Bacteroidia bacterium]|jgi:lipopolysaccharide transport system permease protein|nr:ABC transporter permease [Bacteroidia bacterium]
MEFEISPKSRFSLGLKELWAYRELFYIFTLRDIKVKYKQTVLGFLWAVLQPLLLALTFSFFLGKAISTTANVQMPYELFAFSGLVLWGIFSTGLNNAGNSMVANANIIKKIYFPRLIIPVSAVFVGLFDFAMAFSVFLLYCLFNSVQLSVHAFWLIPLSVVLTGIATMGAGALLAALNVKYRDFRYIIPFLIQFVLFLSPVIYPLNISPSPSLQYLIALNPMTAPLELFRASFSLTELNPTPILLSVCSSLFFFGLGIYYFKKTEDYFADLA